MILFYMSIQEPVQSKEIRQKFVEFFKRKEHVVLPSSSLVPQNDPTALFNVAGMQPLVPYLMGKPHPDGGMLTNSQKCFRTVDLDNIGDNTHCTFFEMLGNWSLGTYFKKEAIAWSYEFLTKELQLDPERLLATVFEGNETVPQDDEAIALWKETGLPEDRIYPCDAEENWWPDYGASGPCGPDSEIYYDLKPGAPHTNPAYDGQRYIEIWNLVFMEFTCDGEGNFTKLEKKNVDTGGGFERFAMILQGKSSVYETDIYDAYFSLLSQALSISYPAYEKEWESMSQDEQETTKRLRIIVDHIRAATHLIGDGVSPTNEGRGYVLRRIIRRAVFSQVLLAEGSKVDFTSLVDAVVENYKEVYPILLERRDTIVSTLSQEVEKFTKTLQKGRKLLESKIHELKNIHASVLSGEHAFELYDTFGFPLSLTKEIAELHKIEVDEDGFGLAMAGQKKRSREGSKDMFSRGKEHVQTMLHGLPKTVFKGYEYAQNSSLPLLVHEAKVLQVIALEEGVHALICDETVFYAESGGQVGDAGTIMIEDILFVVSDTQKYDDVIVHFGGFDGVDVGNLMGKGAHLAVDEDRRKRVMASHTAAHLLHTALRKHLGDTVEQAGSYVDQYRTRFDFSFGRALTKVEISQIEEEVNSVIEAWQPVTKEELSMAEAKEKGAIGLFTEKYGDTVRVVAIGGTYSVELCGGTHVSNTSEIGIAKVFKDSSVASGVRRIEMATGRNVHEYMIEADGILDRLQEETKAPSSTALVEKIVGQKLKIKELESEMVSMKKEVAKGQLGALSDRVQDINGSKVLVALVEASNPGEIKEMAGMIRSQNMASIGLLVSKDGAFVLFSDSDDLSAKVLFNTIKTTTGGNGGGNDTMVQGVGMDVEKAMKVNVL